MRSVYGSHETNALFRRLCHDSRLVEPAMQLLDGPVYLHQLKVNAKLGMVGDVWEWHQDFIFWLREDGMPRPLALTAAVFMDDVNEFNGPLLFIRDRTGRASSRCRRAKRFLPSTAAAPGGSPI